MVAARATTAAWLLSRTCNFFFLIFFKFCWFFLFFFFFAFFLFCSILLLSPPSKWVTTLLTLKRKIIREREREGSSRNKREWRKQKKEKKGMWSILTFWNIPSSMVLNYGHSQKSNYLHFLSFLIAFLKDFFIFKNFVLFNYFLFEISPIMTPHQRKKM